MTGEAVCAIMADMLQARLPLLPPDARVVSRDLAVLLDETRLVVFNGSGQIYTCSRDDREGMRLAAAMFSSLKLARPTALARALEMNPVTVFRSRRRLATGGVAAVRSKKPGPKRRSKLTKEVCARAQRRLDQGWSIRRAAREVGVVEGTLRHALKRGDLRRPVEAEPRQAPSPGVEDLSGPAARAEQDQEKRFALYREAEKLIVQDAPWIPLYHTESHLLVKPYVKDLVMTPQGLYDLRRVRVEAP